MDIEKKMEEVAEAMLAFQDRIREIATGISREEAKALAKRCMEESEPTGTKNFPMPEYARVAELILSEIAVAATFDKAKEYMERTGGKSYCVACGGKCVGHD